MIKGSIYYTNNKLDEKIMKACQKQLGKCDTGEIVSVSLKPMDFGRNIVFDGESGVLSMFKQILIALENSKADFVYFLEHDVFYSPSHFNFVPPEKDRFYYNENVWKLDASTGKALHYRAKQVSGIVVYRETALKHYRKRVEMVEKNGFTMGMGYEPGTHNRSERVDDLTSEGFMSKYPNVDIRHSNNLSPSRWKKEQFRNQKYTEGWTEATASSIPGWKKDDFTFL